MPLTLTLHLRLATAYGTATLPFAPNVPLDLREYSISSLAPDKRKSPALTETVALELGQKLGQK